MISLRIVYSPMMINQVGFSEVFLTHVRPGANVLLGFFRILFPYFPASSTIPPCDRTPLRPEKSLTARRIEKYL
jgi:hypothetical protein